MKKYIYGILKENTELLGLQFEPTIIPCEFVPSAYALIEKKMLPNNTEKINRIIYSDDLQELSTNLLKYISWYNYPTGIKKNMQQFISEI